jgi:hypothetical protein
MTLAEYADFICGKLGKSDEASVTLAKGFVRARWKMIWDSALWTESKVLASVSVTAGQTISIAPDTIERILAIRWNTNRNLWPVSSETVFDFDSEAWDRSGGPMRFVILQPAVSGPSSGNPNLTISGTDDDDASAGKRAKIVVESEAGTTFEFTTTIPTVAASPLNLSILSGLRWIISFTKEVTEGTITVSMAPGGVGILLGSQTEATRRPRFRLLETPSTAGAVLLLGKRKANLLTEDQDAPLLQNVDNALIAFATSDMLERMRQYSKAKLKVEEAAAQMKILFDLERGQQASHVQIIPMEEPDPTSCGGFSGKGYW